jgi:hypothetical protein
MDKASAISMRKDGKTLQFIADCLGVTRERIRQVVSPASDDERKKKNARGRINARIRNGLIEKLPCLVCGDENSEAHHPDYDKPADVVWLCKAHHREADKNMLPRKNVSRGRVTAISASKILGVTRTRVIQIASQRNWKYEELPGRGEERTYLRSDVMEYSDNRPGVGRPKKVSKND